MNQPPEDGAGPPGPPPPGHGESNGNEGAYPWSLRGPSPEGAPLDEPYPIGTVKGFTRALLDLGFTRYVTPWMVRFLYVAGLVLIGVVTLMMLVNSIVMLTQGGVRILLGILVLVSTPLVAFVYLVLLRVGAELLFLLFRMADDLHAIRGRGRS